MISITPLVPFSTIGASQAQPQSSFSKMPFANVLSDAIGNLQATQAQSNVDSYNLALGNTDDLTGIMINNTKNIVAVEFTTQLASRIVSAYKEIMNLNV